MDLALPVFQHICIMHYASETYTLPFMPRDVPVPAAAGNPDRLQQYRKIKE
jgi:hypothetical protein